jgi:hypothetical protein
MGLFSFVDKVLGTDLSGKGAEKAATTAANIQAEAGQEALGVLREDLAPFTGIGEEAACVFMGSVIHTDSTQVTAQDVMSDPFFQALADQQQRQVLGERAALGLAGSGGTEDILTRNLLQLGEGFRQNRQDQVLQQQQARFNQLFNVAGMGQASAAQTGLTGANILTDIGAARSVAPLARAQQVAQTTSGLLSIGGAMAGGAMGGGMGAGVGAGSAVGGGGMAGFSDKRLKSNVVKVGSDEFGNIYEFSYIGDSQRFKGRIAQELQSVRPDAVSVHESGYLQVSDEFRAEAI